MPDYFRKFITSIDGHWLKLVIVVIVLGVLIFFISLGLGDTIAETKSFFNKSCRDATIGDVTVVAVWLIALNSWWRK